jgi:CheY-like chemotaxis protein
VKGLIDLHGGSVTARSEGPGKGSEFTIRLPLESEQLALAQGDVGAGPEPDRLRVLVVEDNRDSAQGLRLFLEMLGHEVRVAFTGLDGVKIADEWRPDVVLCDIGLPGLDGYGVADELRRRSISSHVRLIAITGYGTDEEKERSRQHGYHAHLTKPADPATLRSLLKRV